MPEPREFLLQVKEALIEGGYVFCEVPNEIRLMQAKSDLPHLLFFQANSLRKLFEESGFRILSLSSCGNQWGRDQGFIRRSAERLIRSIGAVFLSRPPNWLDRLTFRHYRYSDQFDRKWLRLLAQR